MRFLAWSSNKAASATVAASSTASGYSANNVKSLLMPDVWRSATGVLTPTFDFDLGSAQSLDLFTCDGHNLASTVSVKADNSNPPTTVRGTMANRENDMFLRLSAAISARYVRYTFSESSPLTYIQMAKAFIGAHTVSPIQFQPEWRLTRKYLNRDQETAPGVRLIEELAEQYELEFKLSGLSESEFDTVYNGMHVASKGSVYPIFIIPRDAVYAGYVMREAPDGCIDMRFHFNEITFKFVEEVRGLAVGA